MQSASAVAVQAQITRHFPAVAGLRLGVAQIDDHRPSLVAEERAAIEKAVEKRQFEFATGRKLARDLLRDLNLPQGPILRGAQRQPLWPEGVCGSITHAGDLVVAAVASAQAIRSVGIDLESWSRVTEKLHGKLFTPTERRMLTAADPAAAGLVFSAKEAGFKATYPLAGHYIGFQEAEIELDWPAQRFGFRYVGENAANRVMEAGEGYFLMQEGYVLSIFVIG